MAKTAPQPGHEQARKSSPGTIAEIRQTAQDARKPPNEHDRGGGRPAVYFTARPLEDPERQLRILTSPTREARDYTNAT